MSVKILAVVDDIFFLSKIQQTARQLGLAVEPVDPDVLKDQLRSGARDSILLDLNHRSGKAIALLQTIKNDPATRSVPVVAFLSHVQAELAQRARAVGCDRILARSAFSQQLPALLRELSEKEKPHQ